MCGISKAVRGDANKKRILRETSLIVNSNNDTQTLIIPDNMREYDVFFFRQTATALGSIEGRTGGLIAVSLVPIHQSPAA